MRELTINAEVTGQFIEVLPKTLDFNACVFNSIYQLSFNVHNKANIPHGVGIKFPSNLKDYLSCSENDVYIQANGYKRISIKFLPRNEIVAQNEVSYYNPATGILEFPVYVCITSTHSPEAPPTRLTIFAILTDSNGLSLCPEQKTHTHYFNEYCEMDLSPCTCESNAEYLIDMGECTTGETVCTELKLTNNSYVSQNYGFLNIPECIMVLPNYGFGEIFPMETKKLTLAFSPEAKDIPNYADKCENANNTVIFRISVSTVKDTGGIKKKKLFKYKFIKKSIEMMEKELGKQLPFSLQEDISICIDLLRDEEVFQAFARASQQKSETNPSYLQEAANNFKERYPENSQLAQMVLEEEPEEPFTITANSLWIKATIIDPLCDLSHQYIEFPDTPCGSYSIMTIFLRSPTNTGDSKCVCGFAKKYSKCKKHICFNAHFEIVGDNRDISVEPSCGDLESGQRLKLTLVARPQLSEDVVMETAKDIKRQELIRQKRLQWELQRQKELAAKLEKAQKKTKNCKHDKSSKGSKPDKAIKKGKKDKKGKVKNTGELEAQHPSEPEHETIPEFVIEDSEIIVDYMDMYPAEMITWKNMEPYYVEARFCCTVSYISEDITRQPEKLYFTTTCKVIKPDFIHNLNTQHISFGPVAVGMASTRIISIQNIQCKPINPTITLLSPTGSFKCSPPGSLDLPPEHLLQLPLKFAPCEEKEETEYFEIKAGSTICPLIVSGKGVECNLTISPDFVVCRLEASTGAFADCVLEINNQSKAPVTIELIKICELEGEIKPREEETIASKIGSTKEEKEKKDKSSKSSKATKGKKGKGDKAKKISKFSQELSEEEEASLKNYFIPKEGESYFEILGGNDNKVDVNPFTKKPFKIHFGVPLPFEEKKQKGKKDKNGRNKEKKSKADSKRSKSSKSSKKGIKQTGPQKYYVAKFNIMLGKRFLRDAIIIATFK